MADICRECAKGENDCMCEPQQKPTSDEIEWVADETTNADYISMAWHAYDIMESLDPMTESEKMRKRRLQKKCIKIIEKCINEVYDDLFDNEEEN